MVRLVEQPIHGACLLEQYCASGAPEVFAQIMRAYGGMVFNVCLKVTKDPADAEDASQAVFLTLAVQCKTGATIHYLGPWLKKVAKRTSLDLVRSRKRRTRRETVTAENRPEHYRVHPGQRSAQNELQEIIRAELEMLPGKYRMPLVLHYFGGMSHDEISREMRCTTAALGVRLHRARKMLGKRLSARGVSLDGAALGLAISATVGAVINDRFIHSTTNAMIAMSAGRPVGMGAMALGSHIPLSLGVVPQLVQEVAHSMARARLRFATLALALSVTMLGGAAEAVRHLPDSIRPNLEFLSPSKALENLFRSAPTPRAEADLPTAAPPLVHASESDKLDIDPIPHYETPPVVPLPVHRHQPILASQVPTLTPPISTHAPPIKSAPALTTYQSPLPAAKIAQADPPARPLPQPVPLGSTARTRPIIADSGSSGSASAPPEPVAKPAMQIPASPPRNPAVTTLSQYIPPPSALTDRSNNLERISPLSGATPTILVGDTLALAGSAPAALPVYFSAGGTGVTGGTAIRLRSAAYTDWLQVRANDVFVQPVSNAIYYWGNSEQGIAVGGVNSVGFSLEGATGSGLVAIEHLPVNSTLVPERPDGHTFIGIWEMSTLLDYDKIDLTVHYDNALAESLGLNESYLKLWVYDDSKWARIIDASFSRDLEQHTLSGTSGKLKYFAVSAPEPTAVFGIIVGAGALLLKRRRRASGAG